MKTVAIIQARMGSTRLPGKVMKQLKGESVLHHVIERVKQAKMIDEIIVATTTLEEDDILAEKAKHYGVHVFRGSSENVLSRYYKAAKEHKADVVVRITSDCPLIDPKIIDKVITYYLNYKVDIVTNAGNSNYERTFPRGLDVEVFSFKVLKLAFMNATESFQLEHVTPYIYKNSNHAYFYKNKIDYSKYRWTLDTTEDYQFMETIYEKLYSKKHDFYFQDIVDILEVNPDIALINEHIEQKNQ